MVVLRDYQNRVITDLWAWFRANPTGNPVVEACVGAGKSIMLAETIRQALAYPGTRILMCVASRELCKQNVEKLLQIWPEAPVGVYSAGLKSKQLGHQILYSTIGSVHKRWHQLGHIDLIMVDEAHNISARDAGMYRDMIRNLLTICPKMRVIGWTGTAFFGNGVWITDAEEPLFTDISARVSMRELLDAGYLAPLTVPRTQTRLSAEGVKMQGGDFVVSQLAKAIDKTDLVDACADELVKLGAERKRWFLYGASVEHCHHIRDALRLRGITAEVISASTPHGERDKTLAMLKAGQLRAIVNVATMTVGVDVPDLDLIALLRNTRSPVLAVQIAGRGMRTAPLKTDCLFIDFTDTLQTLGPIDLIKGRARGKNHTGGDPITKVCDNCGSRNPGGARECYECGAQFEQKPKHSDMVSTAPALSTDLAPRLERHEVKGVSYREWPGRDAKPPTLRVDYRGPMMRIASEWICLEHEGYARTKAVLWWLKRAPGTNAPRTIDEALDRLDELLEPSAIVVNTLPKYPEITSHEFESQPASRNAQRPESGPRGMQLGA